MIATVIGGHPKHRDLVAYQKYMKKHTKKMYSDKVKLRWHNRKRWRLMVKVHDDYLRRNYYRIVEEQLEYDY